MPVDKAVAVAKLRDALKPLSAGWEDTQLDSAAEKLHAAYITAKMVVAGMLSKDLLNTAQATTGTKFTAGEWINLLT